MTKISKHQFKKIQYKIFFRAKKFISYKDNNKLYFAMSILPLLEYCIIYREGGKI